MENISSKSKLFVNIDGKYDAETKKKHSTTVDKVREGLFFTSGNILAWMLVSIFFFILSSDRILETV